MYRSTKYNCILKMDKIFQRHLLICGKRQSGKTTKVKEIIKLFNPRKVFVICDKITNYDDLRDKTEIEYLDIKNDLNGKLQKVIDECKNTDIINLLIIDDINMYYLKDSNNYPLDNYATIVYSGRHFGIKIIQVTQCIKEISITIRQNMDILEI